VAYILKTLNPTRREPLMASEAQVNANIQRTNKEKWEKYCFRLILTFPPRNVLSFKKTNCWDLSYHAISHETFKLKTTLVFWLKQPPSLPLHVAIIISAFIVLLLPIILPYPQVTLKYYKNLFTPFVHEKLRGLKDICNNGW
jgi:hypothetical protein